jgi:hypothetical protein
MIKLNKTTVSDTFDALHTLIQGGGNWTDQIALGDYIDLPSLTIAGYPTDTSLGAYGKLSATDQELTGHGRLLRLIVVGINSFKSSGLYNENPSAPNHVVFQFQNVPVSHRMNATGTNVGGYSASEMRTYLMGDFLTGLTAVGVPASVLWAPSRRVWNGFTQAEKDASATSSTNSLMDTIMDTLWLPTAWEMSGSNMYSSSTHETAVNQAHLAYYASDEACIKYNSTNGQAGYWTASPAESTAASFCTYDGSNPADSGAGCAPAFCVQ